MHGEGIVKELILCNGESCARIQCDALLTPAPGQYLLAYIHGSDSPLPDSVFLAKIFSDTSTSAGGFLAAPPIRSSWNLGAQLSLRGPLGHGFTLPNDARRIALAAFDDSPSRLMPLLDSALKREASVVLVCRTPPDDLPLQVEVQPLKSLAEVCRWADYVALDARRGSMPELKKMLGAGKPLWVRKDAQILVRTPMPCGALAECGVCTIEGRRGHLLVCKDGPVFDLTDLLD